jgi:hypothetical protein
MGGAWSAHGEDEKCIQNGDGCLLDCSAVYSGRRLPAFQRTLLPPSSGRR